MPASETLPPFTIDLDTARNYLSAFRSGTIDDGTSVQFITPPQQQEVLLNGYWAPQNPLQTDEKYDYANAPSCLTMKAFTFALRDVTDLLNRISVYNGFEPISHTIPERLDPVTGIRFYLGMKPNPAYGPNMPTAPEYIPCLVFLPVVDFVPGRIEDGIYVRSEAGKDLIRLPVINEGDIAEESSALYDFSFPCPDTCAADEI